METKTFNLIIGGWYAYKSADNENYSVTRILDIDDTAIHYSIYKEKFDHIPTWEDIKSLQPFIDHVPQAVGALLHWNDIHLVKSAKLDTREDLSGYRIYLHESRGMSDAEIDDYFQEVLKFSGNVLEITLSKEA